MSKTTSASVDRREFIGSVGRTSAAGAVAGLATSSFTAASYAKIVGANDRIRVGFIGVGGMGTGHLGAIKALKEPNNLEPVAVADCWKTRAEHGAELVGAAHSIATPEHWHAKMTIDALDAGKAIYCEKPMTHRIHEAQAVAAKVKETGLPLQVGVQGMSDDSYSSAAKAIEEGVLGQVVQAQIEYVRRYNQQGPWRNPKITDDTPKPDDLDWNAWLGKAPKTDWNPHHYYEWRNYSQYSGGICTDLFIHRITRIMKACNLLYPRRVVGMGGIWQWPDGRDLPDNFEMICEYPRGMTVYVLGTMSNRVGIDHLIRGYRATLYFTGAGWVAKDKDGKVLAEHKKSGAEDIRLHHTNLHNHLRNGEKLHCPIELGMAGVVAVNMANESWATGQMMAWDRKNKKAVPADTIELSHEPEEVDGEI